LRGWIGYVKLRIVRDQTTKRMSFTVRTVALVCAFAAAMVVARAQPPVPAVAVDADDIGGVVVGPGGPEAGV